MVIFEIIDPYGEDDLISLKDMVNLFQINIFRDIKILKYLFWFLGISNCEF